LAQRPIIDPLWWIKGAYDGRPMPEILRVRDICALFAFLGARGWSRAAIAGATGLSESRVRAVRQGTQQITSYEVLERIADGFCIERGLMGLAYTTPGVGTRPPSATARASAVHPMDGKAMALVEEGVFRFGRDNQVMWLPAFFVDTTPVTNDEYARFLNATGHKPPRHWTDHGADDDLLDHPVVNVSHHDATAYSTWAGKTLPTAAEWEKAARGPNGSLYPWGDQPTPAKCNVRETGVGHTTPVGLYRSGVSPYGVFDMAGNVWEWCATDTTPGRFVLKGSAFTSPFAVAAASETNDASADMLDDDTGFRCVCAPTGMMPANI
jgi:formylglycine-generating enzyme required for sulfatase activity